jgi:hypothetical protein
MISFVYLRNALSHSLANEMLVRGLHSEEAFSVSEAVWLCTQHHIGIFVIADNFEDREKLKLRQRFRVVDLKPGMTARELLWKLDPMEGAAAAG